MTDPTFQEKCIGAIKKIQPYDIEQFRLLGNTERQVELIYQYAKDVPVKRYPNGKCYSDAVSYKVQGNKAFEKRNCKEAIELYNKSIIMCPQNSQEAKELLSVSIANRSAVYFDLKEYTKVLKDITYVEEIGAYPINLRHKILFRKGKAYEAINDDNSAEECYKLYMKALNDSNYNTDERKIKCDEILSLMERRKDLNVINPNVKIEKEQDSEEEFLSDDYYVGLYKGVEIKEHEAFGRYAVAKEDIPTGVVVVKEQPHGTILNKECILTNCQWCTASIDQLVACPNCAHVAFCSVTCEKAANRAYHRIECQILKAFLVENVSVNCMLATRIVTQKHINFFKDKRTKLVDYFNDDCDKERFKKTVYKGEDYDVLFFLCRNVNFRPVRDRVHYCFMAVYLMRLIRLSGYFGKSTSSEGDSLSDDEIYIAALLFRHLEILQFNAHELAELRNSRNPITHQNLVTYYENVCIGAAVYPTLSLFNHSCDPGVVRYNVKKKIVARTIRPLKAGEIIFENYGVIYVNHPQIERQTMLRKLYLFHCMCQPCTEMWPKFSEMDDTILRLPCKNRPLCQFVHQIGENTPPMVECEYCRGITSIVGHLQALSNLNDLLPEAENLYKTNHLPEALSIYIKALELFYKYMIPPHPEIIKIQQRIKVCMLHFGNKSVKYLCRLE